MALYPTPQSSQHQVYAMQVPRATQCLGTNTLHGHQGFMMQAVHDPNQPVHEAHTQLAVPQSICQGLIRLHCHSHVTVAVITTPMIGARDQ